ncbi:MAG: DNA methyltransferase [Candidatus Thorarchaeota archaeon]
MNPDAQLEWFGENLVDRFESIPLDETWSFAECSRSDTNKWTHGYHRYPAKFIPQIVERLFDEYLENGEVSINDPFFGSGTTMVSAISRGYHASGTDVNEIAYLMTKVKSTPIEPNYLEREVESFLNRIRVLGTPQETLLDSPVEPLIPENNLERIDYWFEPENKILLGKILRIINNQDDDRIRDFLLIGFSHILKNCSIWLQSSTKPTRDMDKSPRKPYPALRRHLRKMLRGNNEFYDVIPPNIRENPDSYLDIRVGDARNQNVNDESVDLIVSSSPYVTSYEYADLHQLSTIWLNFAEDYRDYREEFIGTAYRDPEDRDLKSDIARKIVSDLRRESERTSEAVKIFFADMDEVFEESYRILKSGGRCCYVIGNTTLKGVDILNAQVFAESVQHCGFELDRVIKRPIPTKILPQTRDKETGQFTSREDATAEAYPCEYIVIGLKG